MSKITPKKPTTKSTTSKRKFKPKTWSDVVKGPAKEDEKVFDEGLEDTPTIEDYVATESKNHPPPSKDKVFRNKWNLFIGDVVARENFKDGHLSQLEVLCNLYAEEVALLEFLKKNGYSYMTVTRNGTQYKAFPEVAQLNRVRAEIRQYSRTLGLLLVKDKELKDPKAKENDWS